MKHSLNVTVLLVCLFLAAQFIGLGVVRYYLENPLPFGIEPPEVDKETSYGPVFISILIVTVIALFIIKLRLGIVWKAWFFLSVLLTLTIALSSLFGPFLAFLLAAIAAIYKVIKKNLIVHNLSELFVYGGLVSIFVTIFSETSALILLVLISVYDYIAVYRTRHMVALARFQTKLSLFAGLIIPYKNRSAILGGGDIGFPLLFTAVAMKGLGSAAFVIPFFTSAALFILLARAEKKKFYPAMPYLSAGCIAGFLFLKLFIVV
jgi:presenilin-like A22 family membrane protease